MKYLITIILICTTSHILLSQTPGFHVEPSHNVLFGDSLSGAGTKLMWLPEKAALRAGSVSGTQWDTINVGQNSAAFGRNSVASDIEAVAFGLNTKATGIQSTAFGNGSQATANQTTAFGFQSRASGNGATSWGVNTHASVFNSTAWGNETLASGNHSTVWGEGNKAQSVYETVIGSYNDTIAGANATVAVATDQLFVVGNGASDASRNNALTVYKNGNTSIGGALTIESKLMTLSIDNQLVDVEDKGYMRIFSTVNFPTTRTVILSDGSKVGQVLFLSCNNGTFELRDGSSNTNLSSTVRSFGEGDTIQLLWNGSDWLEINFSNN